MTTLDYHISTFKTLLSWRFPRKRALWTILLSAPNATPLKDANSILIVVSPSVKFRETPLFREPARESAFSWFGLPERLLGILGFSEYL